MQISFVNNKLHWHPKIKMTADRLSPVTDRPIRPFNPVCAQKTPVQGALLPFCRRYNWNGVQIVILVYEFAGPPP